MKKYELTPEEMGCQLSTCDDCFDCEQKRKAYIAQKKLLEYLIGDNLLVDNGWIKLRDGIEIQSLFKDFDIEV